MLTLLQISIEMNIKWLSYKYQRLVTSAMKCSHSVFQNCNDPRQSIRLSTAFCQMSLAVLQLRHTPILILAQFSSYIEQVLKVHIVNI